VPAGYRVSRDSDDAGTCITGLNNHFDITHSNQIETKKKQTLMDRGVQPYLDEEAKVNHAWEFNKEGAAWEGVQEDEHGNIIGGREEVDVTEVIRRRRLVRTRHDAAGGRRVVRDMIRYMYVMIDMSESMKEKDPFLPPGSRFHAAINVLKNFVLEYFDQNPISHLGIVVIRDGEADMLTNLSGNPKLHIHALEKLAKEPSLLSGQFSLQNGLELAGRSLGHMPKHGSREIFLIVGSISTCDPGDIFEDTLPKILRANVRCSCVALSAEMYVCRKVSEGSGGTMGVCLDRNHLKELTLAQSLPPPRLMKENMERNRTCDFIHMGFPKRESSDVPSLIHSAKSDRQFGRTSYQCPRCTAKQSELPTDCAVCGLKLVLAPHLARSFHHLFPVPLFTELSLDVGTKTTEKSEDTKIFITSNEDSKTCYGCLRDLSNNLNSLQEKKKSKNISMRFQCPKCRNIFCAECDAYLHESLHNCPGCLCLGNAD